MIEHTPLRIAVVGDLHISSKPHHISKNVAEHVIHKMAQNAEALMFVGDMIHTGRKAEAEIFSEIVRAVDTPVFTVLGNHEELINQDEIVSIFKDNGITVLQAEKTHFTHAYNRIGIMGIKGGYDGTFAHTIPDNRKKYSDGGRKKLAPELNRLQEMLHFGEDENTMLLSHYPPVLATIVGENPEWYDLHGSAEIGRIADSKSENVQVIFHGHTHKGAHTGQTEKGIPVFNVALPVLARTLDLTKEAIEQTPPVFVAEFAHDGSFKGHTLIS